MDSIGDNLDQKVKLAQYPNQSRLKEWASIHNLLLLDGTHWHHRTALVVVADNELRRGVTSLFHDHKTTGHPGITKTLQLILPYYWWPGMKMFVTEYIKGCATCYDLPLKFSLPSSSSATSPPFVVPWSNPEPSLTIIFPSALPNLSLPQPAQPPIQPPDQPPDMSSYQSYLLPKYHLSPPEPLPHQEVHLPFPAVEPCPPTPPIPWSQHTCQYLSMEYLADQKLEHMPEENSPMSNDFPESSIIIPADWPNY